MEKDKKKVIGHIPSGLFIVTSKDLTSHKVRGFLASWVQQASFDPPLISLCLKPERPGGSDIIDKEEPFALNVVSEDNDEFVNDFCRKGVDRTKILENMPHIDLGEWGIALKEAKSTIICKPRNVIKPGDHHIVIAEVTGGMFLNEQSHSMVHLRNDGSNY
ncbi:MAG: flavin reductase family protein [Halobacteriovoraceae bacterium]|nr:flavin reductase family protein [Halobacteriovoraceae bacterium]